MLQGLPKGWIDLVSVYPCFAMTKKPNKYVQIKGQSIALPKKACQSFTDRENAAHLIEQVIKADKEGEIDAQDSWVPRHLRRIAKAAE